MSLLTPAQSAVFTSVMKGNSVIWLAGRQEGKTFIGARCLDAVGGVMVAGNSKQKDTNKQNYPDLYHYAPYNIKIMIRENPDYKPPQLVVFDNFEMYDYDTLMDMLKVDAAQKLYLASYWSRTSLDSNKYEIAVAALRARGTKLFST
jgi:hypothetical protein